MVKATEWTATNVESTNPLGAVPVYLDGVNHDTSATLAVIVIQEWWGITPDIKELALDWFRGANSAFMVAVPDLYRGLVADDREEADHLMHGLDFKGAVQDIHATAEYLKSKGAKKVFLTGFCMGGALSIAASVEPTPIAAVAPFYGIPPATYFPHDKVKITAQLHFGLLDDIKGFSDPDSARALIAVLKKQNAKSELFHYDDATHAFCNPGHDDPAQGNKAACARARSRVLEFFKSA